MAASVSLQGRQMTGAGYQPSVGEVQRVRITETKNGFWCLEVYGGRDGWLQQSFHSTRRSAYLEARFRREKYAAMILCPKCAGGVIGYDDLLSNSDCSHTGHLPPDPDVDGNPSFLWAYLVICAVLFGLVGYCLFAGGQ